MVLQTHTGFYKYWLNNHKLVITAKLAYEYITKISWVAKLVSHCMMI